MTREPELDPRLDAALEGWTVPPARPAFRAELKERFLAGAAPASEAPPRDERTAPEPAAPRRAGEPVGAPRRPSRWGSLVGVAAVVLVVVGIRWLVPPATDGTPADGTLADGTLADGAAVVTVDGWTVHAREGRVVVDGAELSLADPAPVARALAAGRRVATRDARLTASYEDELFLELGPDSSASVAAAGTPRLVASAGSVLVATGTGFRGLEVDAPEVALRVTGTVFAVDCYPTHTCVCCLEGEIALPEVHEGGDPARIPADSSWLVDCVEHEGEAMAIPDPHRAALEAFVARADRLWGRRTR